jgi:peptidoglycan/xylan/chitin deacetylase (PgdA/CDA1 family)
MKLIYTVFAACSIVICSCNTKEQSSSEKAATKNTTAKEKKERPTNPLIIVDKKDSVGNPIDDGKKKIYLTFDDGPNPGTRIVIDALKEAKIPATFYMIGLHRYYGALQDGLWKEVNNNPTFEVCNHSFTHAFRNQFAKFYNMPDSAVGDFVRNQDSLHFNNKIIRAPGSNSWRLLGTTIDARPNLKQRPKIMDSLYKLGYYVTGWDWEWTHKNNNASQSPDQLLSEINGLFASKKTNRPNHLVLLTHDMIFADTADAAKLKYFFAKLKEDPQIEFRVISQYPGAEKAFQ